MAEPLQYEATEYTLGLPVGTTEVDTLLAQRGKPIAKDLNKLTHFLQRVRFTVDAANMDLTAMRRRVDELLVAANSPRSASVANPAHALKFASPEEIEAVVDRLSQERLRSLRNLIDDAGREREQINDVVTQVQHQIQELVDAGTLTSEQAQPILDTLDVHVSVPAGLEQDNDGSDSGWRPPAGSRPKVSRQQKTVQPVAAPAGSSDEENIASAPPFPTQAPFPTDTDQDTQTAGATSQTAGRQQPADKPHSSPPEPTPASADSVPPPFTTPTVDGESSSNEGDSGDSSSVQDQDTQEQSPATDAPPPVFDIAEAPSFPDKAPFTENIGGWGDAAATADPHNQGSTANEDSSANEEVDFSSLFADEPSRETASVTADELDLDSLFSTEGETK